MGNEARKGDGTDVWFLELDLCHVKNKQSLMIFCQ